MKTPKAPKAQKDTLRPEYKAPDFRGGLVRGKYAEDAITASNIVVLEPEVAAAFPDSASVNDAPRTILKVARHVGHHP